MDKKPKLVEWLPAPDGRERHAHLMINDALREVWDTIPDVTLGRFNCRGEYVTPRSIDPVLEAAEAISAVPSDIPGLWFAPGFPELTSSQALFAAAVIVQGRARPGGDRNYAAFDKQFIAGMCGSHQ